jgi:cytochrome c oxidase subunit 1
VDDPLPPPEHNFGRVPVVHSARPFWDEKYGVHAGRGRVEDANGGVLEAAGHREAGVLAGAPAATAVALGERADEPHEHIHMPNPSFWPLVTALGLFCLASGLIFGLWLSVVGLAVIFVGVNAWAFEPAG